MTVLFWMGGAIAVLYGLLTSLSGLMQIKAQEVPRWSAIGMAAAGMGISLFFILVFMDKKVLIGLIFCLLLIHICAIVNGLYLNGQINKVHHLIRMLLTLFIIICYIKANSVF